MDVVTVYNGSLAMHELIKYFNSASAILWFFFFISTKGDFHRYIHVHTYIYMYQYTPQKLHKSDPLLFEFLPGFEEGMERRHPFIVLFGDMDQKI